MKSFKILTLTTLTVLTAQIMTATLVTAGSITNHIPAKLVQQGYIEIDVTTLPKLVKDSVSTKFEDTEIKKAFMNKNNIYKIKLTKNNASSIVYINTKGELVEL